MMYLSDFEYLHPFRGYLPSKFEVVRNRVKFCMFWPLIFLLLGKPREILDRHYKTGPRSDLRAEFRADRPTHFLDLAIEIKNTSALKHNKSPPKAIASGRTN